MAQPSNISYFVRLSEYLGWCVNSSLRGEISGDYAAYKRNRWFALHDVVWVDLVATGDLIRRLNRFREIFVA